MAAASSGGAQLATFAWSAEARCVSRAASEAAAASRERDVASAVEERRSASRRAADAAENAAADAPGAGGAPPGTVAGRLGCRCQGAAIAAWRAASALSAGSADGPARHVEYIVRGVHGGPRGARLRRASASAALAARCRGGC